MVDARLLNFMNILDCEESSLKLSLSSSSSVSIDVEKQKFQYNKLESKMEKSNEVFLSEQSYTVSKVSLELSLSVDNTSNKTDERKHAIRCKKNNERKLNKMCTEKSDIATGADISLELSLSINKSPRVEAGACSNHNKLKNNENFTLATTSDNFTSKKRQTKGKLQNRNKKIKVEMATEVRHNDDQWCIKKKLYKSDLGNMSRLILPSEVVESHILCHWNPDQLAQIEKGLPVLMWDCDTHTEHEMKFKRWNTGANVLIKNWTTQFVKRRELKQGDEIGICWDTANSRFKFSVLNRAPILYQ